MCLCTESQNGLAFRRHRISRGFQNKYLYMKRWKEKRETFLLREKVERKIKLYFSEEIGKLVGKLYENHYIFRFHALNNILNFPFLSFQVSPRPHIHMSIKNFPQTIAMCSDARIDGSFSQDFTRAFLFSQLHTLSLLFSLTFAKILLFEVNFLGQFSRQN